MFVDGIRNLGSQVFGTKPANLKGSKGKSDPTTLGIVFMAFACAVMPLDISQLAFAVLGAVLYAALQKSDQLVAKKPANPVTKASSVYARQPKEASKVSNHQ